MEPIQLYYNLRMGKKKMKWRERRKDSNSKTLFYKDYCLCSVKTDRQTDRQTDRDLKKILNYITFYKLSSESLGLADIFLREGVSAARHM